MQQPNTQQPLPKSQNATLGFAFSIAGAILILTRGLIRIVAGDTLKRENYFHNPINTTL